MTDKNEGVVRLAAKQEVLLTEAKKRYRHLHSSIFGEISSMLSKAKLEPMDHLNGLDPSFTALVRELRNLREIVAVLAPLLGLNGELDILDEYISLAQNLASSIDAEDHDALCAAIAALDDKPYV